VDTLAVKPDLVDSLLLDKVCVGKLIVEDRVGPNLVDCQEAELAT